MAKMTESEVRALVDSERRQALAADNSSKLTAARTEAMDYYYGDMAAYMPHADGRSGAVSTDVADTIEGLMPSLMEIFAGADDVVRFDPVGPEDVELAEQESDYVNHVFMNQNPGFLTLYAFIKDSLLSKTGIVKVWWEETELKTRETYYDQSPDAYALVASNPEIDVVEHSEHPSEQFPELVLHDFTVEFKRKHGQARVMGVPPEEFGVEKNCRSMAECNYAFHRVLTTPAKLMADGFDAEQVKALQPADGASNAEAMARDTVDEHTMMGGSDTNSASRVLEVYEHYIRMDYRKDGSPELYRVTTGGQGEILWRDGKPDIVPFDCMPFAVMTPIIVPHRLIGRSVADLVMDIQRIKTALTRGLLDNTYLANNPVREISEAHATTRTLDDLLMSRPGGIVRVKQPGGLNIHAVPSIAGNLMPVISYFDATREWRTGVTRQGQGIDAGALQNQSATAVNQMYSAAQARMKLIARVFAETGIKDMFSLLHSIIRKHGSVVQTVRLRNKWVQVDPSDWKERNDLTINVGLGHGGKAEQVANVMALGNIQAKLLESGKAGMVQDKNLYNTAKELTKALGFKDPSMFFTDPTSPEGPWAQATMAQKPDPKVLELQAKAEIEKTQAEADIVTQNKKIESEMALAQQKFAFESQLKMAEHEMRMKEQKLDMYAKMASQAQPTQGVDEYGNPVMLQSDSAMLAPLIMELIDALKVSNAPKRIVRDGAGKVSHIEPVAESITPTNGGDMPSMIAEFAGQLQAAKSPKRIVRDQATGKVSHTETVTG